MSRHKDAARPPANRHKGTSDNAEISKSKEMAKTKAKVNTAEQADAANIKAEHHECRFLQTTASEVTPN